MENENVEKICNFQRKKIYFEMSFFQNLSKIKKKAKKLHKRILCMHPLKIKKIFSTCNY